ncbi:MAG: ABC transporter substrate-binding protein, partial [Actinomycetota bacterium]|nr:ABC transporter substrate-binding protein [Actinomycetota bacterium]
MSQFDRVPADLRGGLGRLNRRSLLRAAAAAGIVPATATLGGLTNVSAASPLRSQADPTTLTIAMNGSPSDLDPHSVYDYRSAMPLRGPYEGLIALEGSATDKYVPVLAESWEANEDKSVWTFAIRSGVTFHDGTPVDAEAVRLSYERFLTLGIGPVSVLTRFVEDSKQITVPDSGTVVFDLGKPQPLFEAAIASQYGPQVVNATLLREQETDGDWGRAWAQNNAEGTGTGPYRIVEFEPGQQLIMERYEGYWGDWEGEHFDRIIIRVVPETETRLQLIERGEVDIVDNLTPQALLALEQNPDVVVDKSLSTQVEYFILTEAGPLATPEARQAMCYAFPYDEVVEGVYEGYAKRAIGPVAEMIRGFNPETFQYTTDLEKARELFAEAGVAEGTELRLAQEEGDENAKSAVQLFAANLAQIGINLAIETMDTTSYTALLYGDQPAEERPNVMWWGWWPDYNDAWNHLYPQVSCEAWGSKGANAGFYCNERVDELLAESRDAADPTNYEAAVSEVQQ